MKDVPKLETRMKCRVEVILKNHSVAQSRMSFGFDTKPIQAEANTHICKCTYIKINRRNETRLSRISNGS